MKYFTIILSFLTFSLFSQVDLHIEGGDGLKFYIGQDDVVQAEGNVSNASGAVIEFEAAGTPELKLKGNFTNSTTGTYTLGTEKVEFNGSTLQSADFGGDDIYGLRTNNAANVSIDRNVTITGELEFITGHTISTTSSHITIETTGSVTGADDDSHNNGPIAKNFNSTTKFTFPIGDGTSYRYSAFTPASTTAVTMRSQYYGTKFPLNMNRSAPLYKVSQLEYWDMYRTSGSTDGVITLSWDANSDVGDYTDLVVAYYAPWWINGGGNNHTGNNTAGDVESNSPFTIWDKYFTLATTTSDNPLPVELKKFEVSKELDLGKISWETASEINSDYFSILKSTDGVNFKEIGQVKAAGNSNTVNNYIFYDLNLSEGNNYYKLVNFDFDGSFEESDIKIISSYDPSTNFTINVFPNPIISSTTINFYAKEDGQYDIRLFDMSGKIVYSSRIMTGIGENAFDLNLDLLKAGKYVIQMISPSNETITQSVEKF